MVAKTSAARRAAFMAALRATGNQTLAAERARVSRPWVHLHRSGDPEFRRESDAAIAEARARLREGDAMQPPSGWGTLDGEELVVRGGNGRRTQIARARLKQWTPRVEARFLATLAATCNARAACAEVGMTSTSAYGHYHRWQGFARLWDEALETGYARLEWGLLESGCNLFSAGLVESEAPMPGMTAQLALQLLNLNKHRIHGLGKRPGRAPRRATEEETNAALWRAMRAVKRQQGTSAAQRGRELAEWDRRAKTRPR